MGRKTWPSFRRMRPQAASEKKGGRKPASVALPALEDNFVAIVSNHTAGDPMREEVIWTYLSPSEIARELEQLGTPICTDTVRGLLDEFGFHRRQAEKTKTLDSVPQRNEQFEHIAQLKQTYQDSPNPIVSMDSKKKEFLGELFRAGRAYANGPQAVLDHDFPSYATGKIIPHGLYDLKRNVGHLTLGTSHDTSQFACDSFHLWWQRHGRWAYPEANSILLLCDGGGSNNCRHYIFKEDLQRLVNRLGISIRVAHYPPHCSKYNPIEHRLFPHVTRACRGVVFHTVETVRHYMARTETTTGLRVVAGFKKTMKIVFDPILPKWNYTALPEPP